MSLALLPLRAGTAQEPPTGGAPTGGGGVTPMCQTGCIQTVYVSPVTSQVTRPPSTTDTAKFVVANDLGYDIDVYNLVCTRTGAVASCAVLTAPGFSLTDGASDTVMVRYTTGASTGSGTVALTVYHDGLTSSPRTGTQSVTVSGGSAPLLTLRNRPDQLERGLCLTAGAGEAAWQCGDLLVAHGMPAYRTLGRDRTLTLVYNSATAAPRPSVAVAVTQGTNGPSTVLAELRVGPPGGAQTLVASASYTGWSSQTRQVVLTYDAAAAGHGTGMYDYTLQVTNQYGSGSPLASTLTGSLLVVNRSGSQYGRGWHPAGVERLSYGGGAAYPNGRMLWVGGDGSARIYTPVPGQPFRWVAPLAAFRDTLWDSASTYIRTLRHGVRVRHNSAGLQTATINRAGQQTTFGWDAVVLDRLLTVTVPPSGTGGSYTFSYTGGLLDKITDPAGRILDATIVSGQLTGLLDPDARGVSFGYDGSGRMTSRTNRLGYATTFGYTPTPAGFRVRTVNVPYGPTGAQTATTAFEPWDEKGLAVGSTNQVAVDTTSVVTKILGPRGPSIADDATFTVDKWGAPTRIVNALGKLTQIKRQSTVYPALVTQVIYPNNRIVTMRYDTAGTPCCRANLRIVRDSTSHLGSSIGLPTKGATYTYGTGTPDSPTQVADALGRTSVYTYNSIGLVQAATDPRGHVTEFVYDAAGSLKGTMLQVIERSVQTWDEQTGPGDDESTTDYLRDHITRYGYDAKGNTDSVAAPHGAVTSYANDGVGRAYRSWDPFGMVTELTFDPLNRVTEQRQYTAAYHFPNPFGFTTPGLLDLTQVLPGDSGRSFTPALPSVVTTYVRHSATTLDSITGPLSADATRRFVYDARGSLEKERDELQNSTQIVRDAAGLVLLSIARSGDAVVHTAYDVAGRRDSTWYGPRTVLDSVVPGDTVRYVYDAVTNDLLSARNREGVTTRTYFADGSVKSRTFARAGTSLTNTIQYSYNAAGQRTQLVNGPDVTIYTYSGTTGDLTSMSVAWGAPANLTRLFSFVWDALGRRRQITYPGGMVVHYRYDKLGTLRRVKSTHPGASASNNLKFTYIAEGVDASGRLLVQGRFCPGGAHPNGLCAGDAGAGRWSTQNRYNRFGMMVTSQSGAYTDALEYDAAGNISARTPAGAGEVRHTYTLVPKTNRLQSDIHPPASTTYYSYDLNGSRLEELQGGLISKRYFYDGQGRTNGLLYRAFVGGINPIVGGTSRCLYDPDGQMLKPCDNEAGLFYYDGPNVLGTLSTDAAGRFTFVHGPGIDDPLIGIVRYAGTYRELAWVTDGAGRQYAVGRVGPLNDGFDPANIGMDLETGSSGYFGWQWIGGTRRSYGFAANRQSASSPGEFAVFRNRLYDPRTGRWIQEDPIGVAGGINLYQFNGNNPASYTDPFGLVACDPKKDKDCVLVAQGTAGVTAGSKGAAKLGAGGGIKWQAGFTAEAGSRQTVDLNKRKVENDRVGFVKVGASVEFTAFGGSFGVRVGYDSEDPGKFIDFKTNPDAEGTFEVEGMVPLVGIVGPSGSYKLNPAGASISTDPGLQRP